MLQTQALVRHTTLAVKLWTLATLLFYFTLKMGDINSELYYSVSPDAWLPTLQPSVYQAPPGLGVNPS